MLHRVIELLKKDMQRKKIISIALFFLILACVLIPVSGAADPGLPGSGVTPAGMAGHEPGVLAWFPALATGGDVPPGVSALPVKAGPAVGPSGGGIPYQNVPQVLDCSVVSPGGDTRVQPGIVSGPVKGQVSVPGVHLPGGVTGMQQVTPPVGKLEEEGAIAIESVGQTTRVSVATDGTQGNFWSLKPSISADGRYIAFESYASNLVVGDTNNRFDIFVHDCVVGNTTRVSVGTDGTQGDFDSYNPSISSDGRHVAFESDAQTFDGGEEKLGRIYVRDLVAGTTTCVDVGYKYPADGWSYNPSISPDGRYIAFASRATNPWAIRSIGNRYTFVIELPALPPVSLLLQMEHRPMVGQIILQSLQTVVMWH